MAKKFIMKLQRVSTHSYRVTVPKELVRQFKWREKQKLVLTTSGRKPEITIKDWKK